MRTTFLASAAVVAITVAALGGFFAGQRHEQPTATTTETRGEPSSQRKVLYWYDPMYPQQKFDKPGKSPFMDMQLVPKYADEATSGEGAVEINPRMAQNLGIRTATAESGTLPRNVDTVGTVQADENRAVTVQSRTAGWVEKLHVRAINDKISRGQLLAEIYSPDLLAAQEEYLLLSRRLDDADRALAQAARQRLSFLGLSEPQIAQLEREQRARRTIAIHAPIGGIVSELGTRQGAQVSPGMAMFDLVDLSSVWVVAEVPEAQIGWVKTGTAITVTFSAWPGESFDGKVDYIYPGVNSETRTVKVRSIVRNAQSKLKPGMVARVSVTGANTQSSVLVPSEALIRTGTRTVVVVVDAQDKFRPVTVTTGIESGGKTELLSGIKAGELVVVSGQFLIDSEANLQTGLTRLSDTPAEPIHRAEGIIESIDSSEGEVVIAHGPFETLGMPAMTMGFPVADRALLTDLRTSQRVRFGIRRNPQEQFEIVQLAPAEKP